MSQGHEHATADNPRYEKLVKLRDDLKRQEHTFKGFLKKPASDMNGDDVWIGKTARVWGKEVNGRHRTVKSAFDQALQAVEDEINKTDAKVTPTEAKKLSKELG